jgi:hypothetical protein
VDVKKHCARDGSKTYIRLEMEYQTIDFIGQHLEKWERGPKGTVITQEFNMRQWKQIILKKRRSRAA